MLFTLISRVARANGPMILQQRRADRAALLKQVEVGEAEREARLARHDAERAASVSAEQARLDRLVERYRPFLEGMTLYRATRGYVDAKGKPISAEMAEAYETMKRAG